MIKNINNFDRSYISTEMPMYLLDLPVHYLFQVQGNTYNNEKESITTYGEIINLKTIGDGLRKISYKNLKQKIRRT